MMKLSALKVLCFTSMLFLSMSCFPVNGDYAVARWEIEGYVIEVRDGILEIVEGDTFESASRRTYGRINHEFSALITRIFSVPWTVEAFLL